MSNVGAGRVLVAAIVAAVAIVAGVLYFALGAGEPARDAARDDALRADGGGRTSGAAAPPIAEAAAPSAAPEAGRQALVEIVIHAASQGARAPRDGAPQIPIKPGQTHTLTGLVTDRKKPLEKAVVHFTAGLNAGARAVTDEKGRFTITGLYRGAAIVVIEHPNLRRAARDLVLERWDPKPKLAFDFGAPGSIAGTVVDASGEAIAEAHVDVDGKSVVTDAEGAFLHENVSPGAAIVYLAAPGHELRRMVVEVSPALKLTLAREACLLRRSALAHVAFEVPPAAGARPTAVLLPPDELRARRILPERTFPFELAAIATMDGGNPELSFPGLAASDAFQIRVFSEGGIASPRAVLLPTPEWSVPMPSARVAFQWQWPVSAVVLSDLKPVGGARVTFEAANIADLTDSVLARCGGIESVPLPMLPCARKTVSTDETGFFRVETADMGRPVFLTVEAEGFAPWSRTINDGGSADLGGIDLKPGSSKNAPGRLLVEFAKPAVRTVRVTLMGEARGEREVGPGAPCEIAGVPPGIYRVFVREGNAKLLDAEVVVGDETRVTVP